MNKTFLIVPALFLLFVLTLIIVFHFKKKAVVQKVKALTPNEKENILDNLAETVGYTYNCPQDIFVARLDAPQKLFGYTSFYDFSAPYLNMVFDYETIYFDYNGKTWLIEMWKGQYGINAGCELGIYYADTLVSPDKYSTTHFTAVSPKDMPELSLTLNRLCPKEHDQYMELGQVKQRHWWLTIFKMGTFTKPDQLFVNIAIRFRDYSMMCGFLNSLQDTLPDIIYKTNGLTAYFTFYKSNRKYSFFKRAVRRLALTSCSLYCKWFNWITRPFSKSGDKILYLYYYLPFIIRFLFRNKSKK